MSDDMEIPSGRLMRVERSRSDTDIVNELRTVGTDILVAFEILNDTGATYLAADGLTEVVLEDIKIRDRARWWQRRR